MTQPDPRTRRLVTGHRPTRAWWCAAVALLAAFAAAAQQGASPPAETGGPNQAEFSELGHQAFAKFQQQDVEGAIALLEAQRDAGRATHVDRALLGTLYMETGRPAEALEALKVVADADTADPAVLYNAGRAALASGEVELAGQYFERSVLKMPLSPAARELGLLRGAQGRVSEAYRLLRSWVAQNLGDVEARLALIAAGLRLDRAAEVGPLLEGLPQGDPKVDLLRGQHQALTGDLEAAISTFEALAAAEPPEAIQRDVDRLLADSYIAAGRPGDAVTLLAGEVAGDPRVALLLADGQLKTGDAAAAAATLESFADLVLEAEDTAIGPVAYQVILDYGRALAAAGQAEKALPFAEKTTRLRPRDPMAWKGLGDVLMALGRRDEAAEPLETFRRLAEAKNEDRRRSDAAAEDPGAKAILEAQKAMARGDLQRALAMLRQEVALSPRDVRPRLLEVRLLLGMQRLAEAQAAAEKTVELFPESADALYQRGVIYMGRQNAEAAESDLRRALELVPDHVAAMNDLAVVLSLQGKKAEAQALLERLIRLSPDNKLALENLQKMRQGSGV